MITKKKLKLRDKTIRSYIINRYWDKNPEFLIVREVINHLAEKMPQFREYKFAYDYEWEVVQGRTDKGKGDLVFTDGLGKFLIVECKKKDPTELRKQVIDYMKAFKHINSDIKSIAGLAAKSEGWDYTTDEMSFWKFEIEDDKMKYYKFFTDISDPNKINMRDNFQVRYKDIGIGLNNPINTLDELQKKGFIISIKYEVVPTNNLNFCFEIWVKANEIFPTTELYARGKEATRKTKAKALVAAKICDLIYMPYHMKDWYYPIERNNNKKDKSQLV